MTFVYLKWKPPPKKSVGYRNYSRQTCVDNFHICSVNMKGRCNVLYSIWSHPKKILPKTRIVSAQVKEYSNFFFIIGPPVDIIHHINFSGYRLRWQRKLSSSTNKSWIRAVVVFLISNQWNICLQTSCLIAS